MNDCPQSGAAGGLWHVRPPYGHYSDVESMAGTDRKLADCPHIGDPIYGADEVPGLICGPGDHSPGETPKEAQLCVHRAVTAVDQA